MSSSAPVSATNASSPARTVSGEPTNEQVSIADARAFSAGVQYALDVVDRRRQLAGAAAVDVRERLLRPR